MNNTNRRRTAPGASGIIALFIGLGLIAGIIFVLLGGPIDGDRARSAPSNRPLRVVTSMGIFADMAANVGGDGVEVTPLIPAGADPHAWDPSIAQIRAVAGADVFVYNGLGLEPWVERTLAAVGSSDLVVVQLSAGLPTLGTAEHMTGTRAFGERVDSTDDNDHIHDHAAGDPHMWLDIQNAIRYVNRMEAAFSERAPHDKALFKARVDAYVAELTTLDTWFQTQIDAIDPARRLLVTDHDAYVYMAERYGLTRAGFLVRNPDREPSPREMAQLVETIRRLNVPAVFAEPHIGTNFIDELARETGVPVGILYTDSLTENVRTYVDMMRANGNTLVELLGR